MQNHKQALCVCCAGFGLDTEEDDMVGRERKTSLKILSLAFYNKNPTEQWDCCLALDMAWKLEKRRKRTG
jgi:hypothetical protein